MCKRYLSNYRKTEFGLNRIDDKKLHDTNNSSMVPNNLKHSVHGMIDENSSAPFLKPVSLKSSTSLASKKTSSALTDKDLGR